MKQLKKDRTVNLKNKGVSDKERKIIMLKTIA